MHSASPFRSGAGSRSGLVLVVVLALIALLSILIVAFISFNKLSRSASYSYSKQIQAQEIAHGGLEDILNDLHTEIIAGSTTQNSSAEASSGTYSPVYIPNTNWTAQPARLGFASSAFGTDINSTNAAGQYLLPPTFVRESKASQDGTPGHLFSTTLNSTYGYTGTLPINRASAASTTNATPNGRLVSLARWAETDLLSTNASSSFLPTPFVTNAPDWVYVTRAGSRACTLTDLPNMTNAPLTGAPTGTTTASPVVGRYAYVVYDEGALLDINAAGLISSATNSYATLTNYPGTNAPANSFKDPATGIAQVSTGKTYSAYANLTLIPGFSATGGQTVIDNLVKWRNGSGNLSAANGAGTNFYQAAFSYAKSGFLNFQTTSTGTDSPILNRQDLINYFTKIDPNINTTSATFANALPYLGTFSRAANAPSWHPTSDSQNLGVNGSGAGYFGLANPNGSSFVSSNPTTSATAFANMGYKSNAESSTDGTTDATGTSTPNANRDVPNVRWAVSGTVIHYNDDGTYYTYHVNVGDPLVQHRFSLARLAWLNAANPVTGLNVGTATTSGTGTFTAPFTPFNSSLSTTQEQNAVQDSFGLVWDGQQLGATAVAPHLTGPHYDCWDYLWNAGTSIASDVHILTLGEIANGVTSVNSPTTTVSASNAILREPNFFEMLKAGILSGSLGQTAGPISTGATAEGTPGLYNEVYYTEKNRHILQIGANILAQYGSSSIPPAIYLPIWNVSVEVASSGTTTVTGTITLLPETDLAFNTVYGDENLPGLTRFYDTLIEDWYTGTDVADTGTFLASSTGTGGSGWMKDWIIPEIWNIHQAPPTGIDTALTPTDVGSPGYPSPTQFRIHSYGSFDWYCRQNGGVLPYGVNSTLAPAMNWDSTGTYTFHDATSGFTGSATPNGAASSIYQSEPANAAIMTGTVTAATSATPANVVYFMDEQSALSSFYRFPDFLQVGSYSGNLYNNVSFQPWDSGTHKNGGLFIFPTGGPFMGTHPVSVFASTATGTNVMPDSYLLGDGSGTVTLNTGTITYRGGTGTVVPTYFSTTYSTSTITTVTGTSTTVTYSTSTYTTVSKTNDVIFTGTNTLSNYAYIQFVGLFGGEENFGDCNPVITTGTSTWPQAGGFIQYLVSPNTPIYLSVECQDPNTLNWHPYNWISSLSDSLNTAGAGGAQDTLFGDNTAPIPNGAFTGTFSNSTTPTDTFTTSTTPTGTVTTGTITGGSTVTTTTVSYLNANYSFIYNNYFGIPGQPGSHGLNGQTFSGGRGDALVRVDPRTDRFSVMLERMTGGSGTHIPPNSSAYPTPASGVNGDTIEDNFPTRTWGFVYNVDQGTSPRGFGQGTGTQTSALTYPATWALNLASTTANHDFYVDPDGVVRPGDSYRENATTGTTTTGDGCLLLHGTGGGGSITPSGVASTSTSAIATTPASLLPTQYTGSGSVTIPTGSAQARRPVVLNRPFRNVGEMGYTFRDIPFKSIDFFSQYSGDAALLDLFSVTDEPAVGAGQVNLNNTPTSVITAILTGATKQEINPQYVAAYDSNYTAGVSVSTGAPNFIKSTEAASVASQLSASFSSSGPINNRADLVARLDPIIGTPQGSSAPYTYSSSSLIGQGYLDYGNKAVAEAPIRALSGVTSTRTWNLLIDIIAQSGQMSPTAQTLNDFIVQGERRYWLHVSIDRFTGKILDEQLEPVYE